MLHSWHNLLFSKFGSTPPVIFTELTEQLHRCQNPFTPLPVSLRTLTKQTWNTTYNYPPQTPRNHPQWIIKIPLSSLPPATKRLNSSCSDLTIISLEVEEQTSEAATKLVNKHRVLPFVPPSFPGTTSDSNKLIKPSEYLRSISGDHKRSSSCTRSNSGCSEYEETVVIEEEKQEVAVIPGPPPPPLPDPIKVSSRQ